MLHIIKTCQALQEAMPYLTCDDAILLLEDAVYAANEKHQYFPTACHAELFVLEEDTQARAITALISERIARVDYCGFVDLTARHSHSITWG